MDQDLEHAMKYSTRVCIIPLLWQSDFWSAVLSLFVFSEVFSCSLGLFGRSLSCLSLAVNSPVWALFSATPEPVPQAPFNPWAAETPEQQTNKPTQKFSYNSTALESENAKVTERWAHCSQQEREVSSLLPAATSCCVSCPGSTGFSGILKFNQAASKSLLTIINNTRSRWELREAGKPKTCALKRIQVLTLELVSVAGRIKDLKLVFYASQQNLLLRSNTGRAGFAFQRGLYFYLNTSPHDSLI